MFHISQGQRSLGQQVHVYVLMILTHTEKTDLEAPFCALSFGITMSSKVKDQPAVVTR